VLILEGEGAVLGVNLGHPIVTNWALLHSCAEVRTAIELVFGVGLGIDVLDGSTCLKGKRLFWGFFGICLNGQNDVLFTDSCVKS